MLDTDVTAKVKRLDEHIRCIMPFFQAASVSGVLIEAARLSLTPIAWMTQLSRFAEQRGDAIQWNQSNRAYILTHAVSGIDWKYYKSPLPENVYDIYMRAWKNVDLST
jgi:hypothetical protein